MNLRKPDMKVSLSRNDLPDFIPDLYRDLRDRRLLPFVALLLVAIVAVPFAFAAKSEGEAPGEAATPLQALKEASQDTSALTVAKAEPGLRDYHRRLKGRTPTNPFHQRYTAPMLKGAHLHQATEGSASGAGSSGSESPPSAVIATSPGTGSAPAPAPAPVPSPGESPGAGPSGEGSGGGGGGGGGAHSEGGSGGHGQAGGQGGQAPPPAPSTYAVDVRIVHTTGSSADHDKKTSKPEEREDVVPTTPLPGKKREVVNYVGVSPQTGQPLFLVSVDVSAVFGEAHCLSGTDTCQLVELEVGYPETFVYGEGGDRYKVTVTGVHAVAAGG